jgi:hypothetical protein
MERATDRGTRQGNFPLVVKQIVRERSTQMGISNSGRAVRQARMSKELRRVPVNGPTCLHCHVHGPVRNRHQLAALAGLRFGTESGRASSAILVPSSNENKDCNKASPVRVQGQGWPLDGFRCAAVRRAQRTATQRVGNQLSEYFPRITGASI